MPLVSGEAQFAVTPSSLAVVSMVSVTPGSTTVWKYLQYSEILRETTNFT